MTVNSIRYYCLHIQGKISPYSQIKIQSIWIISYAADDLLQSEFVAGYHRAMVTRRKIVERLKRPKWVHLQNRKRVDLRSKLHFLWGTQQPKKLLCVWIWSIVACVVMYKHLTHFTLSVKAALLLAATPPPLVLLGDGFWPTYRWFPRGGGATKRQTTGKRDSQKQEKENKTHH